MTAQPLPWYESQVANLILSVEVSGLKIAEYLHEIESMGLWRDKTDEDGQYARSFKHYLDILAMELRDANIRASSGTFERLLSFYRLYHLELGLDLKTIMRIGVGNLDEIRKVIDWSPRQRLIGPGTAEKMGREEALAYLTDLVGEIEEAGGLPPDAVREDVARRLGREPIRVSMTVRRVEDRFYLNDLILWEGPTAHRPREGVEERIISWIIKRLRGNVRWIE